MNCRSGCPTPGAHKTWGECARAARIQVDANWDQRAGSKSWDGELSAYADARRQGIQPAGTQMHQVRRAVEFADKTGVGDPFRGAA